MDTLEYLKLAAFKIKEMLRVGVFEDDHRANFEKSLGKIEKKISDG